MKLAYAGFDKSGQPISDTIDAAGIREAGDALRRQGVYVTRITPGGSARAAEAPRRRRRGRLKDLAMFSRQLQVLVACGTPLLQALGALERQTRAGPWREAIAGVRARVEEGESLSAAMGERPDCFDSVCRSLIAAGESSGDLPVMLDRVALITRKQLHVRSAIIGAMVYPGLLSTVGVGVLVLLLLFVIPRFGELFKSLSVPLPPTTKAMLAVSGVLHSYWWALLLTAAAAGTGLKFWLASAAGRRAMDTLSIRLPQFGRINRSFITARIARLLGVLLGGHVSVLEALELTERSIRNGHYRELLAKAREAVTRGEAISSVLADTPLITPSVYEAVRSGEQAGRVGALLLNIADFLDEENEVIVRSLTSILEPVILIVMGLLVGVVAMSMFLPMFDLTAMTANG